MDQQHLFKAQELLNEIQSACDDFGLHALKKTVQRIRNFAEQNQSIDIAVVGQFKAGKSSFLNAFFDQPLLPVGNIPVTAVISRMSYGCSTKVTVTFIDGSSKEISINVIQDYVSETGNPENEKNVRWVDIEVPALSNIKAIRLVDTPGIGSVWKHNTETTMDWFPETGAVLFVISAEKPISENELSLLKELYLYSPEIVILLSKSDLFEEAHLRQIEGFTADVIRRTFDRDFPILRYSTFVNTSTYNQEIEQKVFLPLALNRETSFAKILQHKIRSLVTNCLSYLEISYQASLKLAVEKNKLKEAILDEHLNSHYIRRELMLISGSYKEKTRNQLKVYLHSFQKELTEELITDYEAAFPTWKGNLYAVTRQFEKWLNQSLDSALKEILLTEEKSFELLQVVKKHLSYYLKSFRERLNGNLQQVLGIEMNSEAWELTGGPLKKPDIAVSRSFDSHLDMLWFLFPMSIYKNVFRRYFLKQIPGEVEKNLHRLTSDLTERINKEVDHYVAQALQYMNDELDMIESLLSENNGDSNSISERISTISSKLLYFEALNDPLTAEVEETRRFN